MNKIEIQFEFSGIWHIGLSVDDDFIKYFSNQHLIYETNKECFDLAVIFLGKDHYNDTENFVKIKKIYYNDLMLDNLIQNSVFNTDNTEYKNIIGCNYINLNGVWKLKISNTIIREKIEQYIT
jgi:hypothetical protein